MMGFDLRKAYAEELKQNYLKTGFKQGFEAGYAKAKEVFKRPHGKWIEEDIKPLSYGGYSCNYKCNKCNYFTREYHLNFCPNCGVPVTEEALEIIRKREGDWNDREISKDS